MAMERSRTQVMFQFLPGNTFDYSDGRGIWRTSYLETDSIGGEIDRGYILNKIKYRVRNWDGGQMGFSTFDPERYHFGRPDDVRADLFPLTFRCQRCDRAHQYYDIDDLETKNSDLTCERGGCDGELRQYQFVSVHRCGEIKGLNVPSCNNEHGGDYIKLNTQGSQKAGKFKWECAICGWNIPVKYLQTCDCDYEEEHASDDEDDANGGMYTTVHRASSVYYPHYLTTVNLRSAGLGQLRSTKQGLRKGIAAYLGLVADDEVPVGDIDLNAETEPDEISEEELAHVIVSEDSVSTMAEARDHLRNTGELTSTTLNRRLDEILDLEELAEEDQGNEDNQLEDAGDELLQYSLSKQELTSRSLDELEATARERGFTTKADRIGTYPSILANAGINDVRVIEDFPIQTFVYGYTRGSRQDAQIRPFTTNNSDADNRPIFVDTAESEAVQFEIDPAHILLWIAATHPETNDPSAVAGDVTLPTVDVSSPGAVERAKSEIDEMDEEVQRAFILNHLTEVDGFGRFNTETEDSLAGDITETVFTLMHTMSHVFLKQASTISGFDRTNLSEYLFPRALSFVIYANNRNDFNIGGITTMVEQQLDTLITQAKTVGNDCVYDPVCSRRGGACLSCLHVSEISCSYFNQILGRQYLYGNHRHAGDERPGFWELAEML